MSNINANMVNTMSQQLASLPGAYAQGQDQTLDRQAKQSNVAMLQVQQKNQETEFKMKKVKDLLPLLQAGFAGVKTQEELDKLVAGVKSSGLGQDLRDIGFPVDSTEAILKPGGKVAFSTTMGSDSEIARNLIKANSIPAGSVTPTVKVTKDAAGNMSVEMIKDQNATKPEDKDYFEENNEPVRATYDSEGRLASLTRGGKLNKITYGDDNSVATYGGSPAPKGFNPLKGLKGAAQMNFGQVQSLETTKQTGRVSLEDIRNNNKILSGFGDDLQKDALILAMNKKTAAAQEIMNVVNSDNPLGKSAVSAIMPRLLGEVGNLSEYEQKKYDQFGSVLNKFNQKLQTLGTGKLSPTNKKFISDFVQNEILPAMNEVKKSRIELAAGTAALSSKGAFDEKELAQHAYRIMGIGTKPTTSENPTQNSQTSPQWKVGTIRKNVKLKDGRVVNLRLTNKGWETF